MKCILTRIQVSGRLERHGTAAPDAAEHLKHCDSCRQFATQGARIAEQMGRIDDRMEPVSPHLHQRIMAAVHREAESHTRKTHVLPVFLRQTIVPVAAAATILLALALFAWIRRDGASQETAAHPPTPEIQPAPPVNDHALSLVDARINSSVGSAYQQEMSNIRADLAAADSFFSGCLSYSRVLR